MRNTAIAAAIVSVAMAQTAMAESELYLNGGTAVYDADNTTLTAFTVRGGIDFHDVLSAEFEAAFGLGAEELDSGAELELENQFGGYLVGRYPVGPRVDVLGRIGYTTGEFQSSNNGVSRDVDADGFAVGLGGEFMFTSQFGVRGDYTRIQVGDDQLDGGVNVFSLTGVYKFGSVR